MTELARLRLIETAARDLLPTLESYSDDIDLIDFRAALRATPVADTAGIDAELLTQALNNTMDARANIAVFRVAPESLNHAAARLIAAEYAALRTPKPEGEPE